MNEENIVWILFGSIPFALFVTGVVLALLNSSKQREEAVQKNLVSSSNAFRKGHKR